MPREWIDALIGGGMIGLAASLMLYWNGRVAGVSGILNGLMQQGREPSAWRWTFLLGLFMGGLLLKILNPDAFSSDLNSPLWSVLVAGMLVGFGTTMGGGCTSGHGVCGISRMSLRSLVATLVFIAAGILSVLAFKRFGVLS